ncbi:MAG: LON peptidase substrate-binding domain-containing protein [Anaerolineae bacterium]
MAQRLHHYTRHMRGCHEGTLDITNQIVNWLELARQSNLGLPRMEKLPLFPLNMVLFPGTPISLHIFEERYKLMIGQCISARQPFGVVLLTSGTAEERPGQKVETALVGCTASITQVQPVAMGRMNIVAVGKERFVIHKFMYDQPYLAGLIDRQPIPDLVAYDHDMMRRAMQSYILQYAELIARFESVELDTRTLPDNPLHLAFLAMALLRAPASDKQAVLQAENEYDAVHTASGLIRRETALLKVMTRPAPSDPNEVFSQN